MTYTIAALEAELPTSEMTDLVTQILASSLKSIGLFSEGKHGIADLPLDRQPAPYYERWLSSSIRYLQEQNVLTDGLTFAHEIRAVADLWADWEAKRVAWENNPNQQAQSALLEACLRAVPGVLTGKQRATDVMFPGSSMHLVEGIYRGNPQANYFNDVLCATLTASIDRLLQAGGEREIRILEIGAGTGGTTATLLPALQRYPVAEYCYTDVSKAFLMHAEKNFQPQFPALTTAIFDVSKPLEGQSITPGHYDIAIAANVLHATSNIRETLRNAKAALKNQGVLLLSEISAWSLFNHLTFGLLDGWWLYEDTAVRLSGSPGLAPEKWQDILAGEGFESISFPAEEAHGLGQQIVAAVSNGWTRQRIVKHVPPPQRSAAVEHTDVKRPGLAASQNSRAVDRPSPAAEPNEEMSAAYTRQIITEKLSEALKMDAAAIRDDASFADFGVDSIIGVNLVRTISEALQIELETTSLFEYSTVDQLARFIVKNWQEQIAARLVRVEGTSQAPSRPADAPPVEVEARPGSRFMGTSRFTNVRNAFDGADENDSRRISAEPIAIIGMSGRFAESDSLDAFWQQLAQGKDLVKEVSRWSPTDCVVIDSAVDGYCSRGSFVDAIDQFDPAFFGISALEATYMDPQQRLFLEESWRALEDAGYAGKSVHEKQCGVYVGCGSSSYDKLSVGDTPPQAFWGNSQAVTPARIAYSLNLQGPAIAVDTACSSSLVAIHLACQGLWSREMEMALAGGVFLQPTPGFYQVANRAGMLSPDGKCHSFDGRANGFVPGEGVGVVVLKRLRDALADGDHVHGVIAGSGINQDGRSNGLIAPNGRAQERLERSVYERFGIKPESIQVVEAHGTGTLLGDSIEYGAISRAFREYTDKKQFCALGTVKTNIGHTSTAAGVAGVLKLLLSLKHRQIPPSLHFENANPAIDFESGPFYVNTQLREWEAGEDEKRRAAVSSFGFSGTNAHLILEEAPPVDRASVESPGYLVVLSARTSEQLKQQVHNLLAHLERTPDLSMADLSFSLFVGRMHLTHRLTCLARNRDELARLLEQWKETGSASQIYTGEVQEGRIREQVSLKKFGNYCIQECQDAPNAASHLENLAAIAELYVQGYALDFAALFSKDARRVPLPTYPFARERYWVDAVPAAPRIHASASNVTQQTRSAPFLGATDSLLVHLQSDLSQMVMELLNLEAGAVLPDRILVDLGFDSIGLTNFANGINQKFQLDVTPVLFFDYPSVGEIAKYLSVEREGEIRRFYQRSGDTGPVERQPAAGPAIPRREEVLPSSSQGFSPELRFVNEPIAIVGIAGVMPQSEDLDVLWRNLKDSRDLISVIPADRWNWEDYYGDPLEEVNKSNSKWGGFMKEIDKFDPLFFGISPREAQMMDPQQRIFLETVWKAIEDSGQKVSDLAGTRTGLFVGVGSNDYIDVLRNQADVLDGYTASGNSHSVLANRVSFLLNLRGPSAPIDTACSSSLVALHRAIESIHTRSCDMAIVGGVQVILSPGAYISFGMAGMLSGDGKCRTFDKRANGYVRGEGCGAMLLKPLSLAEADGNHIYAVIKATSENHGGRVTTLTAPNSAAQAALLIEAYERAQIDPATVGYIECHGTGTTLGDPIEIQALSKAFAELYKKRNKAPADIPHCGLGTIKTNIGHLETAAGIAGVLNVLLAIKHRQIPANIHFEEINPYIRLEGTPFYVVDKLTPWEAATGEDGSPIPRRAGVSSFGFGGANAHAILEEYIPPERPVPPAADEPQVIVLSAKNEDRLRAYVQSLRAYLDMAEIELIDVAYTLQVGRDEMPERLALVVSSTEDLKRRLDGFLGGGARTESCYRDHVSRETKAQTPEGAEGESVVQALIEQKELSRLAELWVAGAKIDWRLLSRAAVPKRVSLPTYPFARERHWIPGAERGIRVRAPQEAPREGVNQRSATNAQGEIKASLQSFVPVWNPVRLAPSERIVPPETTRILLLGSDQTQSDWVRKFYPRAQLLEIGSPASVDAIETKLRDASFDQLLWFAPDVNADVVGTSDDRILDRQEEGVVAVFRIIKALLGSGYAARNLQWTIVTSRTQRVTERELVQPAHAGIVGLIGSLAKEYPRWDLRLLDVDSLASVAVQECLSLPWDKQGNVLAQRRGEWFRQGLALVAAPPPATPVYRQDGVYVVIGGAGGIGEVWSRFVIEHYQANAIWIGRRPYDAAIEAKLKSFAAYGRAPKYISADATSLEALEQARATILETHPAIHGVVHSAIVLQDQSIARMDESVFRGSFSAKADVSVNMDRVFGRDELDFMLFFSSIIAFGKSAGQSNYSAGCTFKDAFAQKLQQQRAYPVKIMNWGYWGNVGIVTDESYNKLMAQMGIGSIEPDEGMESLQVLVGSEVRQLALIKSLNSQATAALDLSESIAYCPQTAPAILPQVQQVLAAQASGQRVAALEAALPTPDMNDLATEVLASSLISLGLFSNGIQRIADLASEKRPAPFYERWLSTTIRYLQEQHFLADDQTLNREVRPLPDLWAEWETKRPVWGTDPHLQAQIALFEVCLKALPRVLSGRQLATEVLFPNSSMHLVEGIYRGNAHADHFNDVLGETFVACIEHRLRADRDGKIRILEIGAGTGGTTTKLLPVLQRYPVEEYCYTDISKAFLMYAEKQFRSRLPALTTTIFDVSKPLASQSIAANQYDFVIAANVLHATPDIRETLRNVKAALKNQGVLLLNEVSAWALFSHLTFGLLEGWWLYEDAAVRLPGSPGLAPEKWREILTEEGFESILFPAETAHRFGQQIVAAGSNGWTRQRMVRHVPPQRSAVVQSTTAKFERPSVELTEEVGLTYVRRIITEKLSEALRMDAALIRPDMPLTDYGVDSIIGVNLVRTISEALQIELEAASLFECSTVDQLTQYILTNWQPRIAEQLSRMARDSSHSTNEPAAGNHAGVAPEGGPRAGSAQFLARPHPMLHINTSTLRQQSYSAVFTGAEFFLKDHQVAANGDGARKVLPEAAYLEMARAAIEAAAGIPKGSSVVELQNTVWGRPLVVAAEKEVTVALLVSNSEQMNYEIYTVEGGEEIIHCQGGVTLRDESTPAPLNLDELQGQMRNGEVGADGVYAAFTKMGIHYGPAHQVITAVYQGDRELLAWLSLPAVVATGDPDSSHGGYSLHPSLMTGALQAGMSLVVGAARRPGKIVSARALDRLRALSPCEGELFTWARQSRESLVDTDRITVDIDVLDTSGRLCVEMRGLAFQFDDAAVDPVGQRIWVFSTAKRFAGNATHVASLGAEDTIELFLRQEAALQLRMPLDGIAPDRSYFDLGFSSPAISNFIQAINGLLDENLSPSVLFDHRNIRSLAAYLAATYPEKTAGLTAIRQDGEQACSGKPRPQHTTLVPLPRKTSFPVPDARARSSSTQARATTAAVVMTGEQALEKVLWNEASPDDSYEKLTF